jgi:pimeloyl-ACP methyl ester carboxylesterase
VDTDGTTRWLVLIPGTDTHWDTAIGWGQNIELMSSDNEQRMQADGCRLVEEAMKRSGIGAHDSVTLIGHSQGGIIAASLAAGLSKRYSITHVVTAGSPIANHPIPKSTWVTSIENKGELVSNLDGARNPDRSTWLTVRGDIESGQKVPSSTGSGSGSGSGSGIATGGIVKGGTVTGGTAAEGTVVKGAPNHTDITHAMNYQRATWSDAESLGSPALAQHDEHFSEQLKGKLAGTSYYTGRMTH